MKDCKVCAHSLECRMQAERDLREVQEELCALTTRNAKLELEVEQLTLLLATMRRGYVA